MATDMKLSDQDLEAFVSETVALDATHRCARCGAQAYVVTNSEKHGEFLWCSHDFNKHQVALESQGHYPVLDERHKLNNKSTQVHA